MTYDKWTVQPHTHSDKTFALVPPLGFDELSITVDYDDVNHDRVDKLAAKIVKILNKARKRDTRK